MQMEAQKSRIDELEQAINQAKLAYNEAMINLSKISEDVRIFIKAKKIHIYKLNFFIKIHNKRKLEKNFKMLPPRESGVGRESGEGEESPRDITLIN
jgi:hypothetical protein